LGIVSASWIAVKLRIASQPEGLSWRVIGASSVLAGIGFTMALFIAALALDADQLKIAKVGILAASLLAAVVGMSLLQMLLPRSSESQQKTE
jgi:NhaA family Na+:H+ antiporter